MRRHQTSHHHYSPSTCRVCTHGNKSCNMLWLRGEEDRWAGAVKWLNSCQFNAKWDLLARKHLVPTYLICCLVTCKANSNSIDCLGSTKTRNGRSIGGGELRLFWKEKRASRRMVWCSASCRFHSFSSPARLVLLLLLLCRAALRLRQHWRYFSISCCIECFFPQCREK